MTTPTEIIVTTRAELEKLIDAAIAKALGAVPKEPDYRDDAAEGRRLDVSISTIKRMVGEGMPHVYMGDRRRYRAADVDAWLKTRVAGRLNNRGDEE